MSRRLRIPVGLVAKLVVPAAFIGFVVYQKRFAPVAVHAQPVDRGDVLVEVFGRGTVESRRETQLGFDLAGKISDVLVDEGDHVKLGQVLGHLEPRQYQADLRTAASNASAARAATLRLQAEQRRAEATLAYAEREEQRARNLVKGGTISERDFDLAVQQLALARAEASRAQAGSAESQRNVDVASGSLELRKALAMRTALVSPFDGLVIRRLHDPGDPVAVGATVLRVVATDRLWVRAWIDESALGRLAEGQSAKVALPGDREHPILGRVDRIGREADRQTHEILVDVLLLEQPARVAIGQRADVRIELGRAPRVIRAPLKFVQREGDANFCWVNRDGRIQRVPVRLGALGATQVEVVSGLDETDTVLEPLHPGAALPAGRRWKAGA